MLFYRFRVSSGLTGMIEIGPSRYSAAEEFVLTEYAARKWVSKLDLQSGKIFFVGEIGGEERMFNDWHTSRYYSSKARQDGAMPPLDFEVFTLPVLLNTVAGSLGNQQWWNIDEDCVFEAFELNTKTPAELGAASPHLDYKITVVTKTGWASGVSRDMHEYAGFNKQRSNSTLGVASAMVANAAGWTYTDETIAANSPTSDASGLIDLGLGASGTEFLYHGFYDKFCGIYFDIATATGGVVNAAGATAAVQYPKVSASGTVTWTDLNITDGTANATVSFAQSGAITWEQPSDWARQVVASGSGKWYYVRVKPTAGVQFTPAARASFSRTVVTKIKPFEVDPFLYTGDKVWCNLTTTGAATGVLPGTLTFRRVN